MIPYLATGPEDWAAVLSLIRAEFAFMDGRIDPPSSMYALTVESISSQAERGEVWAAGRPPVACMFLTLKPGALHIGKLATATSRRQQGLCRMLVDLAEGRARALGLGALELNTRVELTENHATFHALGFVEVARTAHAGFSRPTSITFRRPVTAPELFQTEAP